MSRGPERHLVHGEWMTEAEAGAMVNRSRWTMRRWRYSHRGPDGRPGLLVEAYDFYADLKAGRRRWEAKGRPLKYRINGRPVRIPEIASRLGVPTGTIYSHMTLHRCGLKATIQYYVAKRQREAEKKILEIIRGG